MQYVLETKGLCKQYKNFQALADLNMHTKYLLWIGVFIIANIVQLLYILSLRKNISEIAESFSEKLFV